MQQQQQQPPQLAEAGPDECAICLSAMLAGAPLVTTSCSHRFHLSCLTTLLSSTPAATCPLCRRALSDIPLAAPAPPRPQPRMLPRVNCAPAYGNMYMPRSLPNRHGGKNLAQFLASLQFERDEPLPPAPAPAADAGDGRSATSEGAGAQEQEEQGLGLEMTLEVPKIGVNRSEELYGMVSVVAPERAVSAEEEEGERKAMDLVCVIDRSGSMRGEKTSLVQNTLQFIVQQMCARDRLSLVLFDHEVDVVSGLSVMSERNKMAMGRKIDMITARGGTNIWMGLAAGLQVLRTRKEANEVSSVLLLSDGQDGSTLSMLDDVLRDAPSTSVHTFGFGANHDANVLSTIAERAGGVFTFIETSECVGPSFATTVGGLMSTAATAINVDLHTADGVRVKSIRTTFSKTIAADGSSGRVTVPDIYAGERRDLVFVLELPRELPAGPMQPVRVHLSYALPGSDGEQVQRECEPSVLEVEDEVVDVRADEMLDQHRNRAHAVDAMEKADELAGKNDLERAREAIRVAIEKIESSVSADTRMSKELLTDLKTTLSNLRDRNVWRGGGSAACKSKRGAHVQQRAAYDRSAPSSYSNCAQVAMNAKWAAFK